MRRPSTSLRRLGSGSLRPNRAIRWRRAHARRSTSVFDNVGRFQAAINALGAITTAVYHLRGGQIARIDARGYRSTTQFDAVGRPVVEIDSLARRTTAAFDAAGQRTLKQDARGWAITYRFDAAGREQVRQYRDGTRVL